MKRFAILVLAVVCSFYFSFCVLNGFCMDRDPASAQVMVWITNQAKIQALGKIFNIDFKIDQPVFMSLEINEAGLYIAELESQPTVIGGIVGEDGRADKIAGIIEMIFKSDLVHASEVFRFGHNTISDKKIFLAGGENGQKEYVVSVLPDGGYSFEVSSGQYEIILSATMPAETFPRFQQEISALVVKLKTQQKRRNDREGKKLYNQIQALLQ